MLRRIDVLMMYFPDMSDDDYDEFGYGYEDYLDEDYYDQFDDVSYTDDDDSQIDLQSSLYREKDFNQTQHCKKLVEGLNEDRRSGEMCDGIITISGKEFPVHRVVLTVASRYFRAMFAGSFKESQQKCIDLKDVNQEAFEVVLNYIYGESDQITEENMSAVYDCADMLCVDCVLRECKDYIRYNCLRMKDKLAAYQLAERMEIVEAKEHLIEHFHQDFERIAKEPFFLELPFEVVNVLIEKRFSTSCVTDSAVQAIISWVTHNIESRFAMSEKLLLEIHLDQVTNTTADEVIQRLGDVPVEDKSLASKRDALIDKIRSEAKAVKQKLNKLKLNLCWLWSNQQNLEVAEFHHSTWEWTNKWSGVQENVGHFATDFLTEKKEPKFVTEELQAVTVMNKEVLMFGSSTVLAYNTTSKTTRALTPLPKPRTNFCVVVHENSLFVVGGDEQDMLRYDWFSNSWIKLSSWFSPKRNAGVLVHNGIMYMLGGYNAKKTTTSNYCISYNFRSQRFMRVTRLNHRIHNPHVAAFGGMLYVFGQDVPEDFISAIFRPKEVALCQIYDIAKKTWSQSSLKISTDEKILDVKTVEDGIMVVLLRRESLTPRKITVSIFNPKENCLQYVACLPLPKESGILKSNFVIADIS